MGVLSLVGVLWSSGAMTQGVFQVSLANSTDGGLIANSIGFRCVYYPEKSDSQLFLLTSLKTVLITPMPQALESLEIAPKRAIRLKSVWEEMKTQVGCADGAWVAVLDVTGLNKTSGFISITAHHSSSDGRSAHIASESVTNNFICPENFVGVSSLGDYTPPSGFCVSKYEMKNDGSGQAISQAAGCSLYRVSVRDDAIVTKCTGMGSWLRSSDE